MDEPVVDPETPDDTDNDYSGFLGGIQERLELLKDGITSGLDNIVNGIVNLPTLILDGLKDLFIPQQDIFGSISSKFDEKFPIISDVKSLIDAIISPITEKKPEFTITLEDYHGISGTYSVIDFEWYEPYRAYVKTFLGALIWFATMLKVYRKIPSLIGGIGA